MKKHKLFGVYDGVVLFFKSSIKPPVVSLVDHERSGSDLPIRESMFFLVKGFHHLVKARGRQCVFGVRRHG